MRILGLVIALLAVTATVRAQEPDKVPPGGVAEDATPPGGPPQKIETPSDVGTHQLGVRARYQRGASLKDLVNSAEREIVLAALEANGHHIANTARELGLERSHLYKKMRALGINHRAGGGSDEDEGGSDPSSEKDGEEAVDN